MYKEVVGYVRFETNALQGRETVSGEFLCLPALELVNAKGQAQPELRCYGSGHGELTANMYQIRLLGRAPQVLFFLASPKVQF